MKQYIETLTNVDPDWQAAASSRSSQQKQGGAGGPVFSTLRDRAAEQQQQQQVRVASGMLSSYRYCIYGALAVNRAEKLRNVPETRSSSCRQGRDHVRRLPYQSLWNLSTLPCSEALLQCRRFRTAGCSPGRLAGMTPDVNCSVAALYACLAIASL